MMPDADIQLWLEADARTQPVMVVPYVQSSQNTQLRYTIGLSSKGPAGRTNLSQGGHLTLAAGQPGALGKIALRVDENSTCALRIALAQYGQPQKLYDFSCNDIVRSAKLR